jgi:pectate lyase
LLQPFNILAFFLFVLFACSGSKVPIPYAGNHPMIAFPGAEGYGKYTKGGRGGEVYIVRNLEDGGTGSLREAVSDEQKRIIIFSISGTIRLLSPLEIKGNKTIAGQTAPGDGICIADYPVRLDGDQIIIQYLRFRMGDRYQGLEGKIPGSGNDDAVGASRKKHIIIDHCSMSWSTDEVCSIYGGDSTTLQWNIISEPLNYSYHFEAGDTDYQKHGYGGIWGGKHFSAHHNLFAHCVSRNPRFNGLRLGATEELADYRNNVIYNWGHNSVYGGEGGQYNIVYNYYKYGPDTHLGVRSRIANPNRTEQLSFGKWFVSGNYVDGDEKTTRDNLSGVIMGNNGTAEDKKSALIKEAHAVEPIPQEDAVTAYQKVLSTAGASFRRDTLDKRIINDVLHRTGKIIDVQGGFPHGTPFEISQTAWPTLKSLAAPMDTDGDGIPDEWERKHQLNPADSRDASKVSLHVYYTNIEMYIHSLTK